MDISSFVLKTCLDMGQVFSIYKKTKIYLPQGVVQGVVDGCMGSRMVGGDVAGDVGVGKM